MLKTPEQYFAFYTGLYDMELTYNQRGKDAILSAIEAAQKDAYNKAIDDAADNAKTQSHIPEQWIGLSNTHITVIDKESILKLKKQ